MPPVHRPFATAELLGRLLGSDPFTVLAARQVGATRGQLRAAVQVGALERLRPGVLSLPASPGHELVRRHALAALAVVDLSAVVSDRTAGHLHRLPARLPNEHHAAVGVDGASGWTRAFGAARSPRAGRSC